MFPATNWQDCTREDHHIAKKGKPRKKKRISFNSVWKHCDKHQLKQKFICKRIAIEGYLEKETKQLITLLITCRKGLQD